MHIHPDSGASTLESGKKVLLTGSLTRREKCSFIVIVILFVFCVIFLTLFIACYVKFNKTKDPQQTVPRPGNQTTFQQSSPQATTDDVCQSFECLQSAAYIARTINGSVDPCQDFYKFACGRWLAEHSADDTMTVSLIDGEVKKTLKDLLTTNDPNSPEAVKKARAYFRSCDDVETISKLGVKPLQDLLNLTAGGMYPTLQPSWKEDKNKTFTDIAEYLSTVGDVQSNAFIPMGIAPDLMQTDNNIIQIEVEDTERLNYLGPRNSTFLMELENAYRQVLVALGAQEVTAAQDAEDVVSFAIKLVQATEPPNELRQVKTHYKRMSLSNVTKMFPQFDWHSYLRKQFERTGEGYAITMDEVVAIHSVIYYTNLFRLVSQTNQRTLLNYGMWQLVYSYLPYLEKKFRTLHFTSKSYLANRWDECAELTIKYFPFATARLYMDKKFKGQKNRVEHMVDNMSKTFKEMLQEVSWIKQPTKEAALKKLSLMKRKIAYPDFILNDTALNSKSYMCNQTVTAGVREDNFFATVLDISKKNSLLNLNQLRKPVDETESVVVTRTLPHTGSMPRFPKGVSEESVKENYLKTCFKNMIIRWILPPLIVNAAYSPPNNDILIAMGIMNPPYYSREFGDAFAYGAVGMVVGHEILHGFDDKGNAFDEKGNLRQWWEEDDLRNFRQKTQCLVDQYNQFQDEELRMNVNGLMTLGENIADIGGIRLAFRAYRNTVKERGRKEFKYPTLPYTQDQLFFTAFAQVWCSRLSLDLRKVSLLTDVHSPNYFRVVGSLQNSEDFARVFNCPVGSPMNPQRKCRVW